MRNTIDMAREALVVPFFLKETNNELIARLKDFEALVRADEREAIRTELTRIVIVPTLTHGTLVKLSDVDATIRERGQA